MKDLKTIPVLLLFAAVLCLFPFRAVGQAISEQDSLALVAVYEALDGPNWTFSDKWKSAPVTQWQGVGTQNGRVTSLTRNFNSLHGRLPDALGQLTELTRLDLGSNDIDGSIPAVIGDLTKLTLLDLSGNNLTGSIPPELASLTNLERLFLYGNEYKGGPGLSGTIPDFIGSFTNLIELEIEGNDFTGSIPESLGNLVNVVDLFIGYNRLSGDVPSSLSGLASIEILDVSGNQLENLPDLSALSNTLLGLFLHENRFTFEDIEPNIGVAQNALFYIPQDSVDTETASDGTLSVTVGGSANEYQWFKDNASIPGATSATYTPDDPGTYFCYVTSPLVPGLTIISRPVFSAGSGITVNLASDEADANINDGQCDVDEDTDGLQCTLRAAIQTANAESGGARIEFDIPGSSTPSISPVSELPVLGNDVIIDGTTQSGGLVELDGSMAGSATGLTIQGSRVTIKGMGIHSFGLFGLLVDGGTGHTIQRNRFGIKATLSETALNGIAAIAVTGGTTTMMIGGLAASDENFIAGGITIEGNETSGISVLRNEIYVPAAQLADAALIVPIDIGANGPTCSEWGGLMTGEPNGNMPPPRILTLTESLVTGITEPGARVTVFQSLFSGTGRGRYWSRWVKPVATGLADENGSFSIPIDLLAGTRVTVTATDTEGNTSELSQLRRPAIYLPGVGGSWLTGDNGDGLWLPTAGLDSEINDRLARLAMAPDGTNIEEVSVSGIVEIGGYQVYGPILAHLDAAGYTGRDGNTDPSTLDLWRFPYDWRKDVNEPVEDLLTLINRLVGNGQDVARSCEVDLVSHSNGGMVANLYVRKYPEHSRNHVHRMITSGTPYLGSTMVAAAHTRGYMFGIEDLIPFFDPAWGRIVQMFRNLPGAYGLMPSKLYWEAVNPTSDSHLSFYLENLNGEGLSSWESTKDFLTSGKLDTRYRPAGLNRNGAMWDQQQASVHDKMNDWRSWDSPPQIFRMVGDIDNSTSTGWWIPETLPPAPIGSIRVEPGDSPIHIAYRESLRPVPGWGDGTVPLVSATLGRDPRVGRTDFSGVVESPWIQPFEYYPCEHVPLVGSECFRRVDNLSSLVRTEQILKSGYEIVPGAYTIPDNPALGKTGNPDPSSDVFYVQSSAPVTVTITDSDGRTTGPETPGNAENFQYDIPGINYWPTLLGAVFTMPSEASYSITIQSLGNGTVVGATRARTTPGGERNREQALFPDQVLDKNGTLKLTVSDVDSDLDQPFQVDVDGDGIPESELVSAAVLSTDYPIPAIPVPTPLQLRAEAVSGDDAPIVLELAIPDTRGPDWQWNLTDLPSWLIPDTDSGLSPATIHLTGDITALTTGVHEAVFQVSLSLDGFQRSVPVSMTLVIYEPSSVLSSITLDPMDVQMAFNTSQQFSALGLDQFSLPVGFTPEWSATGGFIDTAGMFYAGDQETEVTITARDPATGLEAETTVSVVQVVVETEETVIPESLVLDGNFPNPFQATTRISFGIPRGGAVRLEVVDLLGRTVSILVDGHLTAGSHEVSFDGSHLSSGIYFYRLSTPAGSQSGQMVLTR